MPADTQTPQGLILGITGKVLTARCIGIVAELDVAEHLADGCETAEALAAKCGVNAPSLYRMLRYLASLGIFAEDDTGAFRNTEVSEVLRDSAPGSVRMLVRQQWQDVTWDVYKALPEAVQTGETAFDLAHGAPFFDFLAANPALNTLFDGAMAMMSAPENEVIARTYPFGENTRVADIGGGQGGLLATILQEHPTISCVLFDQAQVLENPAHLMAASVHDRCELIAGDFFNTAPPGCDVYILKRILHDWDDTDAARILQNLRKVLMPQARILIVDALIKRGNAPDANKYLDVGIMTLLRGRERTEKEMRTLCESAGLEVETVYPPEPPSTLSLTVAKAA
jgi:ubiquinone/menaquinone biosynthesis C-methylase UbiE